MDKEAIAAEAVILVLWFVLSLVPFSADARARAAEWKWWMPKACDEKMCCTSDGDCRLRKNIGRDPGSVQHGL